MSKKIKAWACFYVEFGKITKIASVHFSRKDAEIEARENQYILEILPVEITIKKKSMGW